MCRCHGFVSLCFVSLRCCLGPRRFRGCRCRRRRRRCRLHVVLVVVVIAVAVAVAVGAVAIVTDLVCELLVRNRGSVVSRFREKDSLSQSVGRSSHFCQLSYCLSPFKSAIVAAADVSCGSRVVQRFQSERAHVNPTGILCAPLVDILACECTRSRLHPRVRGGDRPEKETREDVNRPERRADVHPLYFPVAPSRTPMNNS